MSDSSFRLACQATRIIKPQCCVKGDGKLQSRKIPNIIMLFLLSEKWPSKVTQEESQVWAACGLLALCTRREGSRPGSKPSSSLLWTAKQPLPADLQWGMASLGSAEKQGLVLAPPLPLVRLGWSCIPYCLKQELAARYLMLDALSTWCKDNLTDGTYGLYTCYNIALTANSIKQILH